MRRRDLWLLSWRKFSSEPEIPSLYSFLQPSLFSPRRAVQVVEKDTLQSRGKPNSCSPAQQLNLEASLEQLLVNGNTDEAWKSFKILTNCSSFPSKPLTNSLIAHLSSTLDVHNLKRAYASVVFALEKNPSFLEFGSVKHLLESMRAANTSAPAFALVKCMLANRFFMPFEMWGSVLLDICRKNGSFSGFLSVFHETCRIALAEKMDFMKPDLAACNASLKYYCHEVESVTDAEKVVDIMSIFGIKPNESTFGSLAYLYALKGLNEKVSDIVDVADKLVLSNKREIFHDLICGSIRFGDFGLLTDTILNALKGEEGFGPETYKEILTGFIQNGDYKSLSNLIIESQKVEPSSVAVEGSFGYGVISACISLGVPDKAHGILDELNAQGASIGLGVYIPILKVYCKERRIAEAAQLVTEISDLGLVLDVEMYDALIESAMSCKDFQSAFSLFRDMKESRISELKGCYLTIMTGLTEHHRPELMAAFLDQVVEDPRIKVGTHDWNSIIHAFCKAGRMEDARRTFRRMIFLRFEPSGQTYLSLINGYTAQEKYFSVLLLWNDVKKNISGDGEKSFKLDASLIDAFLYALVKGGFFDASMQVVEKSLEMKIFVDKWRYKQAFMERHKKLRISKLRKRNTKKMEALIAFKNWAGLSS